MSFYRTYRPQIIEDIDNASVREHLLNLLHKEKKDLPHAYLFTGPKGAGKTTAARVIAKLFNCVKPTKDGPCGACEQCVAIAAGRCMDVIEMDAASNRGIDEIRELRNRIGLSPTSSDYTIYIIDEVHMLTTEAFNALLKTLEEPPAHAVFVLATTDREKVPATIQSRCMAISFGKATSEELMHALERIAKAEKIDIEKEALLRLAAAADGSFRDAVKYLEQVSFAQGTITSGVVGQTLSLSDTSVRELFFDHLAHHDAKASLEDVQKAESDGRDMKAFLTDILSDLQKKLVATVLGTAEKNWTPESLQRAITVFTRAYGELRVSPIARLPIDVAVVELCSQPNGGISHVAGPIPAAVVPPKPVIHVAPVPSPHTVTTHVVSHAPVSASPVTAPATSEAPHQSLGLLTYEKLLEHWPDFIAATKPFNHSVAGVLRSSRPKAVEGGIVTIEAFYKFHLEKLAEIQTKQILSDVLKKLFGEKVKIEVVLGKK
jgi:DNA polymerase-3 subunit gamma/tau